MLLQLKRDFDALVVCHCTVEAVVHQRIGDFHSSGEDLIQVTTQSMGDGALIDSTGEVQEVQLSQHMWHVIVETPHTISAAFASCLMISLMISVTRFALSFRCGCSPGLR